MLQITAARRVHEYPGGARAYVGLPLAADELTELNEEAGFSDAGILPGLIGWYPYDHTVHIPAGGEYEGLWHAAVTDRNEP